VSVKNAALVAVLALSAATTGARAGGVSPGSTALVSVAWDGTQARGWADEVSISADGRFVAFSSDGDDIASGDSNETSDVFVRDTATNMTRLVSVAPFGRAGDGQSWMPWISANGRYVAFVSVASDLVASQPPDGINVFVRDLETRVTTLESHAVGVSLRPALSADGRFLSYESNGGRIYVRDRKLGTTEVVSGAPAGGAANDAAIGPAPLSSDGRYVAFGSAASNLVSGDTNDAYDVFVRDRKFGVTSRVSVGSGGAQGNSHSLEPSMSSLGDRIAFSSDASNLVAGDANGTSDVFVRDVPSGRTTLVSANVAGLQGDWISGRPSIDPTGASVAFRSKAGNLTLRPGNGWSQIFVRDLAAGTIEMISVDDFGNPGDANSGMSATSTGGRFVAFDSLAGNLVAGGEGETSNAFVRDRAGPCQVPVCPIPNL